MCKFNKKNDGRRIDPCMRDVIKILNEQGVKLWPVVVVMAITGCQL